MQKIEGKCTECGGDGQREQVGVRYVGQGRSFPECTHCHGTGMEPKEEADHLKQIPADPLHWREPERHSGSELIPDETAYITETIRSFGSKGD